MRVFSQRTARNNITSWEMGCSSQFLVKIHSAWQREGESSGYSPRREQLLITFSPKHTANSFTYRQLLPLFAENILESLMLDHSDFLKKMLFANHFNNFDYILTAGTLSCKIWYCN